MNRIVLEAVSQAEMRPPYDQETQAGDWFYTLEGDLVIRVIGNDMADPETFLFALHELVEAVLCKAHGVSQIVVDRFDEAIAAGTIDHDPDAEPGDHPACPYRREHRAAMFIEHMMAHYLGIDHYGTIS